METPKAAEQGGATAVDVAMMRRALSLAAQAAREGEIPVGAVVYLTEQGEASQEGLRGVLGEGHNLRHTRKDPTLHAEVIAIRAAAAAVNDWRLNACTLVVTLEPCAMCAGLIVNARLGRVVFGAADPKAGACGSLMRLTEDARLNHRVTPIGGVLAEESGRLLRGFFQERRGGSAARE